MASLSIDRSIHASALMASLRSVVLHRFAQHRSYRSTRDELEKLSDHELSDLGLCRCDIRAIAAQAAARH